MVEYKEEKNKYMRKRRIMKVFMIVTGVMMVLMLLTERINL